MICTDPRMTALVKTDPRGYYVNKTVDEVTLIRPYDGEVQIEELSDTDPTPYAFSHSDPAIIAKFLEKDQAPLDSVPITNTAAQKLAQANRVAPSFDSRFLVRHFSET